MTTSTEELTDEALVARIRDIQAELRKLDGTIEKWSEEVETRRTLLTEARGRVNDLHMELHDLVSVPVRMGVW